MKLISMTDFILSKESILDNDNYKESDNTIDFIFKYANFLKQPLTLGMFVPCDDDVNVLAEPPTREQDYEEDLVDAVIDKRYEIAQSKVLFNTDIQYDKHIIHFKSKQTYQRVEYNTLTDRFFFGLKTIEDCIHLHLDLAVSF